METSDKAQSPQLVGLTPTFQDGRHLHLESLVGSERLAGQVGPGGYILHRPNSSGSPEIPSVCGRAGSLSVYLSPIQAILYSLGIHKGSAPCCSLSPASGSLSDCLH